MKALLDTDEMVFNGPELGCVLCLTGLPGGNNKLHDRSPYGNTGAITGATWTRLPSGLWVLSFDGIDDYVDVGNPASFDIYQLSIEAWVRPPTAIADNWYNLAYHADRLKLRAADSANQIMYFAIKQNSAWKALSWTYTDATVWYHVVGTFDGVTLRLYVNGVERDTLESAGTVDTPTGIFKVGSKAVGPTAGEQRIGLFRYYNQALIASEILSHFSREKHLFGVW